MKLLSYTTVDGIPTFTDSFVRGLFERMKEEGHIGLVFSDGSITSAEEFLKLMKFGSNHLFVIELDGEVGGCCWLNGFEMRKADFHFCFFSSLRGDEAVEVGREVILELLDMRNGNGDPIFDLFVGLVSVRNKAALRWCERMEFGTLGVLPSAIYDAKERKSVPGQVFYAERGKYGKGRR